MNKISLSIPKLNWPKAGDDPFLPTGKPRHVACLDMAHRTFGVYATAYKEAADRVVACAIRKTIQYPDLDVFPAGYLYRHYLELALKEIICDVRRCTLKAAGISNEHNLSRLWRDARSALEDIWPGKYLEELSIVEGCIMRFHKEDTSSQGFRYPIDSKDQKTLQSLSRVNLCNLRAVMTRVAGFLDAAKDGICEMHRTS
ncbi:MAG: hypothetical protein PCFJNLEI_03163 [Verrucomicrobiae bacterium]|nr:hypothetical protein [Verrucomicrobiae bacterium]